MITVTRACMCSLDLRAACVRASASHVCVKDAYGTCDRHMRGVCVRAVSAQAGVFRPSHIMHTMTIEEFGAQCDARERARASNATTDTHTHTHSHTHAYMIYTRACARTARGRAVVLRHGQWYRGTGSGTEARAVSGTEARAVSGAEARSQY